ncbi:inorganic triphosphatase [Roseibium aquae]|uniref:Inorganic triphosphatase n=1 Tax=Roseibium aquae TaxID=1323746 RepID=A0A916WWJ3_9HYPH|nr:CYTH and CHAD domain-containing protein [Roseibium aquae]GGB38137.1 inorganic triphosphatase [Roseibium aquae]
MSKTAREIELKLEVPEEAQAHLRRTGAVEGFSSSRTTTRTLHSVYVDTPDQALRKAKISLRVRKVGRSWVQTVKIGTGVAAGVSSAIEVETRVSGGSVDLAAIGDDKIVAILHETIAGQALAPCFETVMKRTTRILTADQDGSEIEVAFDTGQVTSGGRTEPLSEVEFELKSGSAEALFKAARGVIGATPFRFSPCSKAERGYRLAEGRDNGLAAPKLAERVVLDPEETAERAFREILRSCLDQITHNRLVVLQSDAPEGPHQLRVGLRRLRSAFRLFKPVIHPASFVPLDVAARTLAGEAGEVRDLDVLTDEIVRPLKENAPAGVNVETLVTYLEARREAARVKLKTHLGQEDINHFILDLATYTEGRGWLDPDNFDQTTKLAGTISDFARAALDRQWRKVSKFGARIDDLSIEERHDMRKALKKLRYGIEFFDSLYPGDTVKPFLKRMKRLQDIFGYLNDVAMAEKLALINDREGEGAVDRAQAVGFAIGWHEAQSAATWPHAKGYWRETKKSPKFWN